MSLENKVGPDMAKAMFPFDIDVAAAAANLSLLAMRDIIAEVFGDHPDFEARQAILFGSIRERAGER
jgi:hypothetical protein